MVVFISDNSIGKSTCMVDCALHHFDESFVAVFILRFTNSVVPTVAFRFT